jgi:hypothetical protein
LENSKISIAVVVVLLLGVGWYLLSGDSEQQQNTKQGTSAYSDSIAAQQRPSFTAQKDTTVRDPVGERLAPGTALVKATVIDNATEDEQNARITIKAEEILGYGSSTPPIAAQEKLTIDVERILKNNPDTKHLMQKGSTITVVVSSQQGVSLGDSQGKQQWSLIELKKQDN